MRLFKGFNIILLVTVWFLAGCASSSVRFTHEEIKNYPLNVQEKIIKGEISPGMTLQQVRYAWGNPDAVNRLQPEDGKAREEWIYSSALGISKTQLIFMEGVLTYIISTEPGRFKK